MRRTPRRLIGMLIAAAALLAVIPASAQAAFTVTGSLAPDNPSAGAHSNVNIHVGFTGGQVKDLTIGLPPGMVGDPNAAPHCTVTQLNADACPANTKVGSVTANATVTVVAVPVTINVSGDLYNLTPQPGEPARFGIVLRPLKGDLCALLPQVLCDLIPNILPPVILQSGVQLRPDYGLNTVINNIPNTTSGLPTTINSQDITLFGTAPGTGKPFMRNPTQCTSKTTTFSATPYTGAGDTAESSFTPTNCGALDFSPSFSADIGGPGQNGPDRVPTTVSTSINQDPDEAGLIRAQVAVPSNDLVPNADLLGATCTPAEFQTGACPANSVVGSALASSPLLSLPLSGPVALVSNGGPIPDIGLDLNGQLHLLLRGTLTLSEVVTFDGLPDIPISAFQLTFTPSPGLLMANRDLCAPPAPVFHADFLGYNGASTSVDSAATVNGCGAGNGSGNGATAGKCKKGKKKHKKHRAAESKKKHKKHSCKKKKHKHKKR